MPAQGNTLLRSRRMQESNTLVLNIGKTAVEAILKELRDPSKAASKMLSPIKGNFSCEMTLEEENLHGKHFRTNNN